MKNTNMLSVRGGAGAAAIGLVFTLSIVHGRAQQASPAERQYPYPSVRDQRGVIPPGPRVEPWASPLGDGPFLFETYEQRNIRVVVLAKGLSHPWSLAFLPDGSMLVTERAGRLRIIRNGVLDPQSVAGLPASRWALDSGLPGAIHGYMDVALHPRFAENHWVYLSYTKPLDENRATVAVARGRWDGRAMTQVRDIFVAAPVITRSGAMVPFATRANAAIRGWATQLGTRICWRLESYATACGFPNPGLGVPAGAVRMIRLGETLPLALRSNTSAVWSMKFDTHNSLLTGSSATPIGRLIPVFGPDRTRIGVASPLAV